MAGIGRSHCAILALPLLLLTVTDAVPMRGERDTDNTSSVVMVRTPMSGTFIGRTERVLDKDIDVFLGIPYAKPPIGDLRFKRAESLRPTEETRYEALTLPPSCHQVIDTSFDRFPGVEMWNANTNMSEDCLYLNIWSPSNRAPEKLAVLLWIYGGSFNSGSSTLDIYDGRVLAAQGDVVVVSVQYRVGALGFLHLGTGEAPGNMGLLDQALAIEWISDNIGAFSGDRERITLFGESAGAASTSLHLLSPITSDFIKSSIMQSGTGLGDWAVIPTSMATEQALALAELVGCPTTDVEKDAIVTCLRNVSAEELTEQQFNVPESLRMSLTTFNPVVDNYFLTEHPLTAMKSGKMKRTSILLGVNKNEGNYFLAYLFPQFINLTDPERRMTKDELREAVSTIFHHISEALREAILFEYGTGSEWGDRISYKDALDDILGDSYFKCPVVSFARLYAERDNPVYMYNFVHQSSGNPWPDWLGVLHGYEIDHVFGAPLNNTDLYDDSERRLSRQMITYWTNFAKTGDPNFDEETRPTRLGWPQYDVSTQRHVILDTSPLVSAGQGLRDRQCTLWRDVIRPYQNPQTNEDNEEAATCTSTGARINISVTFIMFIIITIAAL